MKKLLLAGVAATAVTFGAAGTGGGDAQAAPTLNGSVGGAFGVGLPPAGTLLDLGITASLSGGFTTSTPTGEGDYAAVPTFTLLSGVTPSFTLSVGQALSFTLGGFGGFAGTVDQAALTNSSPGSRTVRLFLLGDFTPAGALGGFGVSPSSLTLTLNQTGGPGTAISASFTLASPPEAVSAPMSLALLGMGLVGLAAVARRKRD